MLKMGGRDPCLKKVLKSYKRERGADPCPLNLKGQKGRGGSLPFERVQRGGCADHCPLQRLRGEGVWIIAL